MPRYQIPMVVPLSLSSPRTPSAPTTTGKRTSMTPSVSTRTSLIPAHRGDGYTRSDRRVLLHRGTRGNLRAALCRGTPPCGLTTSRPRSQVGCKGYAGSLGHWRPTLGPSLLRRIYVHAHICISFLCRSDASARLRNLPSTPHPNFIDMRRAYGTKISLRLCSYFFVCTIGHRLLRGFPRNHDCQDPRIIS